MSATPAPPERVARLAAAHGMGESVAMRRNRDQTVPLAVTGAVLVACAVLVAAGVAFEAGALAAIGVAGGLVALVAGGVQLRDLAGWTAEYLFAGGVVRQRRRALRALPWAEVREVVVWIGDLVLPGQVLAYYLVDRRGRRLRVEALPARASLGGLVVDAARERGVTVTETTDCPDRLWSL
jgi:hypothetical protein